MRLITVATRIAHRGVETSLRENCRIDAPKNIYRSIQGRSPRRVPSKNRHKCNRIVPAEYATISNGTGEIDTTNTPFILPVVSTKDSADSRTQPSRPALVEKYRLSKNAGSVEMRFPPVAIAVPEYPKLKPMNIVIRLGGMAKNWTDEMQSKQNNKKVW